MKASHTVSDNHIPSSDPYFDVLVEVCRAVTAHDVDAALEHFAEDCVFVDGPTGTVTDRQGLLDFLAQTWEVLPDYAPRPVAAHTVGDTIAMVFEASGTLAGRELRWPVASFSTFDENRRIVRDVYFVDQQALDSRLAGAGPTATAAPDKA
jgi:ketosteroid isomerase-like protein